MNPEQGRGNVGIPEEWARILDNLDDAIFIEDSKARIIFANSSVEKLYGYSRDELMKEGLKLIVPPREMRKIPALVEELLEKGELVFETFNILRGGSYIPVRIYARKLEHGNTPLFLLKITDLTERKKKLAIIKMAAELSTEAMMITDTDGRIVWINRAAEEIFGYTGQELVGKKFYEHITLEMGKYRRMVEMAQRGEVELGKKTEAIVKLRRKDGSTFTAEVSHTLIKINEKVYAISVIRDISRRMEYEQRLMEEKRKFREILDEMLNMVLIIQDGKIAYINKTVEEVTGWRREEVLGEPFQVFVAPEMRALATENYLRRMAGLPVPSEYVLQLMTRKGKRLWGYIKARVVDYEGKKSDLVSVVDITPLKRKEEKIFSINEAVRKLMLSRSKEDIYGIVLKTLETTFSFDGAEIFERDGDEVNKISGYGRYPNEGRHEELKNAFSFALKYGESRYLIGVPESMHKKGAKEISEYITPISSGKTTYGFLLVWKDGFDSISLDDRILMDILASHLALRLELHRDRERIRRAKETQELMLRIIGHDLKTPLAVISGYADLLREECREEYLDDIKSAVDSMLETINKAKMLSSIDIHSEEAMESVNLKGIGVKVTDIIKKRYPGARVKIRGDARVNGHPLLLEELMMNLLDNAFKHGATEVSVKLSEKKEGAVIRIADNGPGIGGNMKDRIFEPFVKYGKTGGTGLGLAIVKKIVDVHRGNIKVEDNEPRGSVFVIELPKA